MKIDSVTELLAVEAIEGVLVFHDRLTNETADQYDSGQLQTVLKPALVRAAGADDFMRHRLLDKGVTLRYEYQTLAGTKLVSIEIALRDCAGS